jgi:pimeloyl-ACP methyl ester carboxylesterase
MRPVVAIGGILMGKQHWAHMRDALEREFVPYSIPGFDGTKRLPLETPHPYDYAHAAITEMKNQGISRAHLLASCSGCVTALAVAAERPDMVASLTLIGYWHRAKEWKSRTEIDRVGVHEYARRRVHKLIERLELHNWLVGCVMGAVTDPEAVYQVSRMMVDHPVKDLFNAVRPPITCVVGLEDKVISPAAQINVASKRGARVFALEDVGHLAHVDAPLSVAQHCESFWRMNEEFGPGGRYDGG